MRIMWTNDANIISRFDASNGMRVTYLPYYIPTRAYYKSYKTLTYRTKLAKQNHFPTRRPTRTLCECQPIYPHRGLVNDDVGCSIYTENRREQYAVLCISDRNLMKIQTSIGTVNSRSLRSRLVHILLSHRQLYCAMLIFQRISRGLIFTRKCGRAIIQK